MYEKFIDIINKNNGIITAKDSEIKGISRTMLKKMTDNGYIQRIDYGVYATDKFIYDEYYLFQLKHKNIVFSYNEVLQNYMFERILKPVYILYSKHFLPII